MAKAKKNYINLACSECKNRNYYVNKSRGKTGKPEKLELMKFCNHCRKHTLHIEGKKDSKKK